MEEHLIAQQELNRLPENFRLLEQMDSTISSIRETLRIGEIKKGEYLNGLCKLFSYRFEKGVFEDLQEAIKAVENR